MRWAWGRLTRLLRGAIGDDGTGGMWERLTPDGRQVLRLAFVEARELGHPCMADEHVLLGLLRHGASQAATLLEARGLDLAAARTELLRVGPTLGPDADPAGALRSVGIDVEEVRRRLEETFGTQALQAAEWRVQRRAKRSFEFAGRFAARRGDARIGPDHLLFGVLQDARDPLGTQLSRRSRRELAPLGFAPGRPNPVRLQLEARGIDVTELAAELGPAP